MNTSTPKESTRLSVTLSDAKAISLVLQWVEQTGLSRADVVAQAIKVGPEVVKRLMAKEGAGF